MCQTLSELGQAAASLARRFDPALVPPGQLAQVLRDAGAIEKMMATVAALAAARMARSGPAATAGRQAARDLAQASGTSLLEAERALQAAQQLEAQPEVAAAALAGELSRPQLGLVAGAVAVNPGPPPELLALAQGGSLGELGEGPPARAAHQDLEARRHAVHRARGLRPYTDASGTSHLHAKGHRKRWPWSWPPSPPSPSGRWWRLANRAGGSGLRPTPSTGWWRWPAPGAPRHPGPRSCSGWTTRSCSGATRSTARCARSPGSGRSAPRR